MEGLEYVHLFKRPSVIPYPFPNHIDREIEIEPVYELAYFINDINNSTGEDLKWKD